MSNTDKELDIDNAAIKAAEYLYSVDTQGQDVPPELIEAISRLRQLVNEEFVAKDKQVSSQLIFDTLHPIIQRLITQARIETANWAVHYVDKIERENPAPDDMWRTFKFIRNGMREEFERAYGVDPAPSYDPSKARLASLQGEEE